MCVSEFASGNHVFAATGLLYSQPKWIKKKETTNERMKEARVSYGESIHRQNKPIF